MSAPLAGAPPPLERTLPAPSPRHGCRGPRGLTADRAAALPPPTAPLLTLPPTIPAAVAAPSPSPPPSLQAAVAPPRGREGWRKPRHRRPCSGRRRRRRRHRLCRRRRHTTPAAAQASPSPSWKREQGPRARARAHRAGPACDERPGPQHASRHEPGPAAKALRWLDRARAAADVPMSPGTMHAFRSMLQERAAAPPPAQPPSLPLSPPGSPPPPTPPPRTRSAATGVDWAMPEHIRLGRPRPETIGMWPVGGVAVLIASWTTHGLAGRGRRTPPIRLT